MFYLFGRSSRREGCFRFKSSVRSTLLYGTLSSAILLTGCLGGGGGGDDATTATSPTTPSTSTPFAATSPVLACTDLAKQDFSKVQEAPATITSATVDGSNCVVTGVINGRQRFQMALPTSGWTQRFLMQAGGGYAGWVSALYTKSTQAPGCTTLEQNQMVLASTDNGHTNTYWPQGDWAINNPQSMIDFAYGGVHKMTVLAKAVIKTYYGMAPQKSYLIGCSYGGLGGMQEAQRYPEDYDGILAGSPTIDDVETNTFWHAWFVRSNSDSNSYPILTADKIPALAAAVKSSCGDEGGLIQDPRACKFDVATLQCPSGTDNTSCLTAAQVDVVKKIWDGPRDEFGVLLAPRGMPVGSELSWLGSMVPKVLGQKISWDTSGDYQWSYEFPNYMSTFGVVTGITNQNMEFTKASFDKLTTLGTLINPTNPDLSKFAARGGKLIMWNGWADSGTTPYTPLNYWAVARNQMGQYALSKFLKLYMIPGVGHCHSGFNLTQADTLTPLIEWVEKGTEPDKVKVDFMNSDRTSVLNSRPVYPYPSMVKYAGTGDIKAESSWVKTSLPTGPAMDDITPFRGLANYVPGKQMWCEVVSGSPVCTTK